MTTENTDRRLFEWVEIQQPLCVQDYGQSPCDAVIGVTGDQPCYNTRFTCQDPDAFDTTSSFLSLNFCYNQSQIPTDKIYLPWLESVSVKPPRLNIGGGDRNSGPGGIRGALTCSFSDHPYSDYLTDPYVDERNHIASDVGTFWTKWRARNPFYMNRVIKYNTCYLDDKGEKIEDSTETRTYFISGFTGPTRGDTVSFTGDDILVFALNDRAQAPKLSTGKLSAAINASATSIVLEPAGIGDAEYPAAGFVAIGDEVASFTREADTLTIVRAQKNTQAAEHDEGDTVQICLEFVYPVEDSAAGTAMLPKDILETLLVDYADVDEQYLDLSQWADTTSSDFLPRLYTAFIAKPTGVRELIGEMMEQMYFATFWVDTAAKLRIKAVRPPAGDDVLQLDSEKNLLADSVDWSDDAKQLLTQVWVYYAQFNPVLKLDEEDNFRVRDAVLNQAAEGLDQFGTRKVKKIYSRWITSGNGAAAVELGDRLIERYGGIPKQVKFELDEVDGHTLELGDFVQVRNRQSVDIHGFPSFMSLQIISMKEIVARHKYQVLAMQYTGDAVIEPDVFTNVISGDQENINLRTLFDNNYAVTLESGEIATFIFRQGATVTSTSTATESLITGSWAAGVIIRVILEDDVVFGGRGGDGGEVLTSGYVGGPCMDITHAVTITNNGIIGGGGGGGGGGDGEAQYLSGGGGGASFGAAPLGSTFAVQASPGGLIEGGDGGSGGGKGGDLGEDGLSGGVSGTGATGGAAGAAISAGANLITWELKGDVRGAEID